MAKVELFGTGAAPTREKCGSVEWRKRDFVEYDVECDTDARKRMRNLAGETRTVPV